MIKKYPKEELRARACYRAAWNIHHLWQERGSSDTRILDGFLTPDDLFLAGQSVNGGSYREHVVPRLVLCKKIHEIYELNSSQGAIYQAAEILQKFLKIVLITLEERDLLDKKLGLKQAMPKGWCFEKGDTFERLKVAGIKFDPLSS